MQQTDPISVWTPHDVAEWLYMQNTKDDHTHTFLVHSIDGPALLGLTREQMIDWKVKPIDATTILKGVEMLKRIQDGDIGWAPGSEDHLALPPQPSAPTAPKPAGGRGRNPRKKTAQAVAPSTGDAEPAATDGGGGDAGADGGDAGGGAEGADETFGLTSVTMHSATGGSTARRTKRAAGGDGGDGGGGAGAGASPNYLKKMMGELHQSDHGVPLWKEEMVERVKRAATVRQMQVEKAMRDAAGDMKPSQRALGHSSRALRSTGGGGDDDASLAGSQKGMGRTGGSGGGGGAPSVADSNAESGVFGSGGSGKASAQVREIERKAFWYQDAIHEQELQQQLLDAKIKTLSEEVQQVLDQRNKQPELRGVGAANAEKELAKRQQREKSRLSRTLQVSEERVADAERLNRATVASINKMRRGRADFLQQMSKLDQRVNEMVTDMKHFAAAAHASLDEKEKVESRLKRQQYDYRNELAHNEHVFENLSEQLQVLDERISYGRQAEEDFLQAERQKQYRGVQNQRDAEQKRELRLGFLQNHVRGQEMDFQRLHRIMGVKFTPEKPDSVQDIVKASLNHEQRNASLLHYVGVLNVQSEEIEETVRQLEAEEKRLQLEQAKAEEAGVVSKAQVERAERSAVAVLEGIEKRNADLGKLCPLVETLCGLMGGASMVATDDGGALALKGCRPDTLADYLRLMDVAVRELRDKAHSLPTAQGNEWLRDFLSYKEINTHPTVMEIRADLEEQAVKQKEAKAAQQMLGQAPPEPADDGLLPPVDAS